MTNQNHLVLFKCVDKILTLSDIIFYCPQGPSEGRVLRERRVETDKPVNEEEAPPAVRRSFNYY